MTTKICTKTTVEDCIFKSRRILSILGAAKITRQEVLTIRSNSERTGWKKSVLCFLIKAFSFCRRLIFLLTNGAKICSELSAYASSCFLWKRRKQSVHVFQNYLTISVSPLQVLCVDMDLQSRFVSSLHMQNFRLHPNAIQKINFNCSYQRYAEQRCIAVIALDGRSIGLRKTP